MRLTLYEEKLLMIDGFSWQRVSNTENMPIIGHALMLSTVLVENKNKKTLWTSTANDSSNNDSSEMKMIAKQFRDILWS